MSNVELVYWTDLLLWWEFRGPRDAVGTRGFEPLCRPVLELMDTVSISTIQSGE